VVEISEPIKLPTEFGNVLIRHFSFSDSEGSRIDGDRRVKEGVVVAK